MPDLFLQLSAILAAAVIFTLAMKWLGQPPIIAYILTGVIVGPAFLGYVHHGDAIAVFGNIGVVFLLFIVGLGIHPKLIREVGAIALVTGLGQIAVTSTMGFLIANWLGYPWLTSLYLSVAFTFSSTIIILQLLYAKEENETLYGRISIGFLLVQDLVAMLLFLILASVNPAVSSWQALNILTLKVCSIIVIIFILMRWVIPQIETKFSSSRETIFLFALAVCFIFAYFFESYGFSKELGALLAGVILSASPHHRDVAVRLAPIRDFFLMLFFVVLGTSVSPNSLIQDGPLILAFSLFILVCNPLIVILLMRPLGYTLATSFYAGLTVTQVSEFSLILLATGVTLGHINSAIVGSATMVGLITIFFSTYYIMNNKKIYSWLEPSLRLIFGPDKKAEKVDETGPIEVVLFGCHRLGEGIIEALTKLKIRFLVVDHDPEIIRSLRAKGIPHLLGTATDPGLLDSLPLSRINTFISTVPDLDINLNLVEYIKAVNDKAVILCVANQQSQANVLYQAGATYVIVPPFLGRRFIVDLITQYKFDRRKYESERAAHLKELAYLN